MDWVSRDKFFHEISTLSVRDSIVVLDIDGTLVCSSHDHVTNVVRAKVNELRAHNTVYVFSNNFNGKRSRMIAQDICVPYIDAPHKKPHTKILRYIDHGTRPVVTIGDKFLTDGLFAMFTKTKLIRVRRYCCPQDSMWDRLACMIDDCAYAIARICRLTK